MEPDFCGYATKAGVECTDGLTIMPGAFKHQDQTIVPLVWMHGHNDPENILGHALLEDRDGSVYTQAFFNDTTKAQHAKKSVIHKDIRQMSIWANQLIKRSNKVFRGSIKEVSLVLAGANPGALIDPVTIRHDDGGDEQLDDEAIIYTGEDFSLSHADTSQDSDEKEDSEDNPTLQEAYQSLTPIQKDVIHYFLSQVVANGEKTDDEVEQSDTEVEHSNVDDQTEKESDEMTRNVFDQTTPPNTEYVLTHDDMRGIFADAAKKGSLKAAVDDFALAHSITNISILFPDAKNVLDSPEMVTKRLEWVNSVLSGTRKSPFTRIKTQWADLTVETARAKGYVKGNLKTEEVFGLLARTTGPQTIYKKQKLDRDDILDITDFDVVTWLKAEMRVMLDAEIARAVLLGDGREVTDPDKIIETNIRPIAKDDELYAVQVEVDTAAVDYSPHVLADAILENRKLYRGSGSPTMYVSEDVLTAWLLQRNGLTEERLYRTVGELAASLRVGNIVPVEAFEDDETLLAIIVNLSDYTLGADRGGQVTMFDDFDIDYNQYKYLIETRLSGALTRVRSAIVVRSAPAGP